METELIKSLLVLILRQGALVLVSTIAALPATQTAHPDNATSNGTANRTH